MLPPDLKFLWLTWWTVGGTKSFRYKGTSFFNILKKVSNLWLYLLFSRLIHPVSSNNFDLEHDLVAPVTMSAASIWICSILYFSSQLQLSQTTSEYSKVGRMKEKYIVSSVLLKSVGYSELIMGRWTTTMSTSRAKNSGSILRNAVLPTKHSYRSVTDGRTDGRTDRQKDDGQSDPYVLLCFAGDTKMEPTSLFIVSVSFTFTIQCSHTKY